MKIVLKIKINVNKMKPMYDFQLVLNSNYALISHRSQVITIFIKAYDPLILKMH